MQVWSLNHEKLNNVREKTSVVELVQALHKKPQHAHSDRRAAKTATNTTTTGKSCNLDQERSTKTWTKTDHAYVGLLEHEVWWSSTKQRCHLELPFGRTHSQASSSPGNKRRHPSTNAAKSNNSACHPSIHPSHRRSLGAWEDDHSAATRQRKTTQDNQGKARRGKTRQVKRGGEGERERTTGKK